MSGVDNYVTGTERYYESRLKEQQARIAQLEAVVEAVKAAFETADDRGAWIAREGATARALAALEQKEPP